MADRNIYLGNASDKAIEPTKIYIGDANDKAQLVSKIYVGNQNNKAVQVWPKFKWGEIYQECQYLYNTSGSEYIVLSKKPDSNTRMVIDAQLISFDSSSVLRYLVGSTSRWGILAYNNGNTKQVWMMFDAFQTADDHKIKYDLGNQLWTRHTFDFNRSGGNFYIDTTYIGRLQNTFSSTSSSIRLWGVDDSREGRAKAYIYSCKIYQGNDLIYDLVPCYRKSDLKPGMYDFANDYFHTNNGSGEFYKGPDVD